MPSTHSQRERSVQLRKWALGFLVLLAVLRFGPVSFSTALFSTTSQSSAVVGSAADWTNPTVDLIDPGPAIRGTVTLTATASDAETGIRNVVFAWAPTGTTNFTTICTDASSPYSCAFATAGIPDQEIDIRVVATDNSNFTMTDMAEAVYVDNTLPTGSLNSIPSPMSGVVTISATATDAASGVANVVIQRSLSGLTTWTTICTDVDSPYSCRFDSTTVSDGTYDFRATVTDLAGNVRTTATVANRIVSNVASSVSVDDPGPILRGAVTITANANATLGVASVRIQRAPNGTTTWTDLCTDTTSPYSCPFVTSTVPDGLYVFRAVLTDTAGQVTTSATVGPSQVDNSVVRGFDVQVANSGTAGRVTTGDTISYTYTRSMKLTSILTGWTGNPTNVVVRLRDGASLGGTSIDDTIDVFTTSAYSTAVNLGAVNVKSNIVKSKQTTAVNATMTHTTVTVNGTAATQVTLTFGTVVSNSGGLRTNATTPANMVWTPSAAAQDTANVATSTAPTTELGSADRDF